MACLMVKKVPFHTFCFGHTCVKHHTWVNPPPRFGLKGLMDWRIAIITNWHGVLDSKGNSKWYQIKTAINQGVLCVFPSVTNTDNPKWPTSSRITQAHWLTHFCSSSWSIAFIASNSALTGCLQLTASEMSLIFWTRLSCMSRSLSSSARMCADVRSRSWSRLLVRLRFWCSDVASWM